MMEFDVNKMDRVNRKDEESDIFKSKYLKENVRYIHYCDEGDMYCIPVDGKRIYDPLFHQDTHIVGTIVGFHIRSKGAGIYQTENDNGKMDSDETDLYKDIGNTAITKTYLNFPLEVYSDGEDAYIIWWAYLVRLEYMILIDPYYAANYQYGKLYNFLHCSGREKIWNEEIKPHLIEKPLLPILVHNAEIKNYECTRELNKAKRKAEYAKKVYDELVDIMNESSAPHPSKEEIEDISAAMIYPFRDARSKFKFITLPENLRRK